MAVWVKGKDEWYEESCHHSWSHKHVCGMTGPSVKCYCGANVAIGPIGSGRCPVPKLKAVVSHVEFGGLVLTTDIRELPTSQIHLKLVQKKIQQVNNSTQARGFQMGIK